MPKITGIFIVILALAAPWPAFSQVPNPIFRGNKTGFNNSSFYKESLASAAQPEPPPTV